MTIKRTTTVGQVLAPAAITWITTILFLAPHALHAENESPAKLNNQANKLYKSGEFQSALETYNAANEAQPDTPEISYNRALAHYKLNQFTEANNLLNQALNTTDKSLESKIKYNMGNVAYAQALQNQENTEQAINHLKSAITRYRDALEINPADEDAKTNIHNAQSLIKQLIQQQKQQQQQNQDQQDDENQDDQQQDQENQQQQQSEDGEQEENQEQQQSENQEQQDENPQQQSQKGQQNEEEQQQQPQPQNQQQPEQGEQREVKLTPEQAEQLLQAIRDKERERQERKAKLRRVQRRRVLKDW